MARPTRKDQIAEIDDIDLSSGLVHVDAVRSARASRLDSDTLARVSSLFAVISDPNRLRIVRALQSTDLCVGDIAATVGLSESAVSHHLRLLRESGLVRNRRDGRLVWYALDDEHVIELVQLAVDHAGHVKSTDST